MAAAEPEHPAEPNAAITAVDGTHPIRKRRLINTWTHAIRDKFPGLSSLDAPGAGWPYGRSVSRDRLGTDRDTGRDPPSTTCRARSRLRFGVRGSTRDRSLGRVPVTGSSCPGRARTRTHSVMAEWLSFSAESAICTLSVIYEYLCRSAHNTQARQLTDVPLLCALHHERLWMGLRLHIAEYALVRVLGWPRRGARDGYLCAVSGAIMATFIANGDDACRS